MLLYPNMTDRTGSCYAHRFFDVFRSRMTSAQFESFHDRFVIPINFLVFFLSFFLIFFFSYIFLCFFYCLISPIRDLPNPEQS